MTSSQRPPVRSSRCRRWVFWGTLGSSPEGISPGLDTRGHGRGQAQGACPVVPGRGVHKANSDHVPVEPDTEGPDGVAAGLGRSAKRDQDSMMSLSPGVRPDGETEASDGAAAGLESVPADKARSARRDQDPVMSPWTGGAVCLPRTGPHTTGDGAAGRCGHRGGARSLGGGGAVEFGRHPILSLPPGACPGGETMRLGVLLAGSGRFLGRERGPGTSEAAPAPCGQIAQQPCATVRAPMLVGGTPSCRRRPPGAFSTNRAATLCKRQGTGAGGWDARSCWRRLRGAFREIAQLPYASVREPLRVGGARGRAGGGSRGAFREIAQLPYANVRRPVRVRGVAAGWGRSLGRGGRRTRTGPHTTGDGAAGRGGCRGGVGARSGGAICKSRPGPYGTGHGGDGRRGRRVGVGAWSRGAIRKPRPGPYGTGDGGGGRAGCRVGGAVRKIRTRPYEA
jgi:hypothetical protein